MSIGRVGNNQLTREILFNIQTQLSEQERLFQQVSTNKKISKPSDDPIGTSEAMGIRSQLQRNEQYEDIVNSSDVWTNISSTALDSAVNAWKRVNEIAVSASDGTKSADDLKGLGEELDQILNLMVQLGNTENAGVYVFGGAHTTKPPFQSEVNSGTGRIEHVYYEGDSSTRNVKISDSTTTSVNVLGSNAGNPNASGSFIDTTKDVNAFKTLIKLRDQLLNNDTIGISGAGGIINKVGDVANSLIAAQITIGGTQELIDLNRSNLIDQNTNLNAFLSQIEDADIAQVILELNNVQNVYEAALASAGRILQPGLLQYL